MSEFLMYLLEEKGYLGYRKYFFYGESASIISNLYEKNISTEQTQRRDKEEKERSIIANLLTHQTRDREERSRKMVENQNAVNERLKREQEVEKEEQLKKLQAKTIAFNNTLFSQRKAKEEEQRKKEMKLREEKRRLRELEEELTKQKARQRELERKKREEGFSSREQELLKSIRQTGLSISELRSKIEAETDLIERTSKDTLRLLETLEETQQSILRKEKENLEWQQRYKVSERLREETQKAYLHETKERQREEAEMQLTKLESTLRIADSNLIRKWLSKEFDELKNKITNIRNDFEKGNYETVGLSADGLCRKLETIEQEAYGDEKLECQREYVASRFFGTLRYLGYEADMRQQDYKDARSPVLIKGKLPSGRSVEITIPFGEVYRIKFSGLKEEECCSEEIALRKIMDKFGISSRPLEPLQHSDISNGKSSLRLQFRDGDKKIELTQQFCG